MTRENSPGACGPRGIQRSAVAPDATRQAVQRIGCTDSNGYRDRAQSKAFTFTREGLKKLCLFC